MDEKCGSGSDEPGPGQLGELLGRAGALLSDDPSQVRQAGEDCLRGARASGDNRNIVRILNLVGEAAWNQGDYPAVRIHCTESLELAGQGADASGEHKAANLLGLTAWRTGDYHRAEELLQSSLNAARQTGDDLSIARVSNNLGVVMQEQGRYDRAQDLHRQSLGISEQQGNVAWLGISLLNLALLHSDQGDWEEALNYAYRALVAVERSGDDATLAYCYATIGEIYLRRGLGREAIRVLTEAGRHAEAAGSAMLVFAAGDPLADACLLNGELAPCRVLCERHTALARQRGFRLELAANLRREAEVLLELREPQLALNRACQAETILVQIGDARELGQASRVLGRVRGTVRENRSAEQDFARALRLLDQPGPRYECSRVHADLGRFLIADGRVTEGMAQLQSAGDGFKSLNAVSRAGEVTTFVNELKSRHDPRLALLHDLVTLADTVAAASDFVTRALERLRVHLGFQEGVVFLEEERRFLGAGPFCWSGPVRVEEALAACAADRILLTASALRLPLRVRGRSAGFAYLQWFEPRPGDYNPAYLQTLSNLLSLALERSRQQERARTESGQPGRTPCAHPDLIGESRPMREVYGQVEQVAPTRVPVLILGESGTGKELIARLIVQRSTRAAAPFLAINCAAIPETLLEAELFGVEPGTATNVAGRIGRFEQANRGTILLDEVGDMGASLQARLLRILQDQCFERVGGRKTIRTDVRLLAATNRDLLQAMRQGKFRHDLFYRLNVITITIPPLRERQEDIPLLVDHFIQKYNRQFARDVRGVSPDVVGELCAYRWPGNVRELENLLERLVILCRDCTIQIEDLPEQLRTGGSEAGSVGAAARPIQTLEDLRAARRRLERPVVTSLEKGLVLKALEGNRWKIARAARQLKVSRAQFYRLMKRHHLERLAGSD
jgi:DNA-binding NtrC family response regulator/tetratricopeptide (TPR) repeat protein